MAAPAPADSSWSRPSHERSENSAHNIIEGGGDSGFGGGSGERQDAGFSGGGDPSSNISTRNDNSLLEVGMSGLSLVGSSSSASVGSHTRKGTESTMSTSPVITEQIMMRPSSAPVSPATTHERLSLSQQQQQQLILQRGISAGHTLPSPIGMKTLNNNSSIAMLSKNTTTATTCSPQLTLTPNSSETAGGDWHSSSNANNKGSPFASSRSAVDNVPPPTMPFLVGGSSTTSSQQYSSSNSQSSYQEQQQQHPEHRRGNDSSHGADFHSFDSADGLLGLEALHDRADSMRHNMIANQPSPTPDSAASPRVSSSTRILPHRDRPPLSQSYGGAASADEPPFGAIGTSSSSAWRNDDSSNSNNRRRASSYEMNPSSQQQQQSQQSNPFQQQQQQQHEAVSQKFGALPSLQSHLHQQHQQQYHSSSTSGSRASPSSFEVLSKPRHMRSVSQPGPHPQPPPAAVQDQDRSHSSGGGAYYDADLSHHSYKSVPGLSSRSMMSQQQQQPPQPPLPMYVQQHHHHLHHAHPQSSQSQSSQQQHHQDFLSNSSFASMPNLMHSTPNSGSSAASYGSAGGGVYASGLAASSGPTERRDSLDFQVSPGSIQYAASDGYSSGGHSPHQHIYYSSGGGAGSTTGNNSVSGGGGGHHVRQPTAESGASSILSSSQSMPIVGFGSGGGGGGSLPRHFSDRDDELSHPLMGEHIEVPDQHHDTTLDHHHLQQQQQLAGGAAAYVLPSTHPLLRGTHGHSMSMDALPALRVAAPPKVVYSVKFKRSQRNFVLGPRITRDLKIGTYVKVEADRGEDLGIVVGQIPVERYSSYASRSSFSAGMGPSSGGSGNVADLKRIIRLATHDEVSLLGVKREEEAELLRICLAKVRQRGLPMNVVDAEYQFDRHKLTFFFEAEGRVDFRELVRDLFSMYKTRIWMQQLDKNTSTSNQAILAPPTANMQMDFGTPIIAPASEFADSINFNALGGSM